MTSQASPPQADGRYMGKGDVQIAEGSLVQSRVPPCVL